MAGDTARRGRSLRHADFTLESLEQRSLFDADPLTGNHPLWTIPTGTATIDGRLTDADWSLARPIARIRPETTDGTVTVRMLAGDDGLRIGAEIRDPNLNADGDGRGRGNRWEFDQDDSIQFFFDIADTRRSDALPESGRVLGYNFGAPSGPINRVNGAVTRWDFLRGGGASGSQPVTQDNALYPGLRWVNRKVGTLNKNGNTDTGWTTELFIPWGALGLDSRPANGRTIGMNFRVFYDDGGERPPFTPPLEDFADAARLDGSMVAVASSFDDDPRTGWPTPVGYAAAQFVDQNDHTARAKPRPIRTLEATPVSGYAADLLFTAPAGTLAPRAILKGHASQYQVRISTTGPIQSVADWQQAAVIDNTFVPSLRGQSEKLRIGNLQPGTTYYVSVRAADAAGRLAAIGNSAVFTTLSTDQDPSNGQRIMVSPEGGQLQTESGEAFLVVGGTVSASNLYVRALYSGLRWGGSPPRLIDFSQNTPEGTPADYFDALVASGVNTLRLQLEWIRPEVNNLTTQQVRNAFPQGIRSLQWNVAGRPGQTELNPEMGEFLSGMMAQAARTGVRLIVQTFNNFNYFGTYGSQKMALFDNTPFSALNGGPLNARVIPGTDRVAVYARSAPADDAIDPVREFFTNDTVLQMCKDRLTQLAQLVDQDPNGYTVAGFELYNEWDDFATIQGRTEGTRARALFVQSLAQHLRQVAPEILTFSTTIGPTPSGPVGRAVYYSNWFDVLHPHFYTAEVSQPVNNPDADRTARVASAYAAIGSYWLFNRRDNRPVHNGEWDLANPGKWPGDDIYYTGLSPSAAGLPSFTLADDEANYRVASWVSIAGGLAGQGLRIGSRVLPDAAYPDNPRREDGIFAIPLSPGMRRTQRTVSAFISAATANGFDFTTFNATPLAGRISTAGLGLRAYGSSSGTQALVYAQVVNAQTSAGGQVRIDGLESGQTRRVTVWSTDADPQGLRILSDLALTVAPDGRLVIDLPQFTREVILQISAAAV